LLNTGNIELVLEIMQQFAIVDLFSGFFGKWPAWFWGGIPGCSS